MGPIDYSGAFADQNPSQAFTQWFNVGSGVREKQLALQEKERQAAAADQMRADLTALSADPTPQKVAAMSLRYPQLSEQFKRSYDMLTPQQQQAKLSAAIPAYAAIQAKRFDIAAQSLRDTAQAMENGGETAEAARTRAMATLIEDHPETAHLTMGMLLSNVMGPDKFAETFGKLGQEARAAEQAPAELRMKNAGADKAVADAKTAQVTAENAPAVAAIDLRSRTADAIKKEAEATVAPEMARLGVQRTKAEISNISSQMADRAKRLALDEKRLAIDIAEKLGTLPTTKLDATGKKAVDEAVTNAAAQTQAAATMTALAKRIEDSGMGWGAFSWVAEKVKGATGTQGDVSALRQEYARVRNSLAIKSLPPGPATDKDIELAMRGFPSENADGKVIAQFLRGMSKMARIDAEVSSAKAEWVSTFGGLAPARMPSSIGGIKVDPGMKFEELATGISIRANAGTPDTPAKPGARPPLESFNR